MSKEFCPCGITTNQGAVCGQDLDYWCEHCREIKRLRDKITLAKRHLMNKEARGRLSACELQTKDALS